MANVKIPEEYRVMGKGEERFNMCKAFEDYRLEGKLEGKLEGMQEHLVRSVCKKLLKNKPSEVIADELEEELPVIERVIEAQKRVGNYDVELICKALAEQR